MQTCPALGHALLAVGSQSPPRFELDPQTSYVPVDVVTGLQTLNRSAVAQGHRRVDVATDVAIVVEAGAPGRASIARAVALANELRFLIRDATAADADVTGRAAARVAPVAPVARSARRHAMLIDAGGAVCAGGRIGCASARRRIHRANALGCVASVARGASDRAGTGRSARAADAGFAALALRSVAALVDRSDAGAVQTFVPAALAAAIRVGRALRRHDAAVGAAVRRAAVRDRCVAAPAVVAADHDHDSAISAARDALRGAAENFADVGSGASHRRAVRADVALAVGAARLTVRAVPGSRACRRRSRANAAAGRTPRCALVVLAGISVWTIVRAIAAPRFTVVGGIVPVGAAVTARLVADPLVAAVVRVDRTPREDRDSERGENEGEDLLLHEHESLATDVP